MGWKGSGVGIKMSWVEKNRKTNNRGWGRDDYSGLESTFLLNKIQNLSCFVEIYDKEN